MDRHDTIQPLLTEYTLGELDASARQRVQQHLDECAACAAEAGELAAAFHGIGLAEAAVAPPAHLRGRVLETFARHHAAANPAGITRTKPARWTPGPLWLGLAAGLVLVLGGLVALSMQRTEELRQEVRRIEQETAQLRQRITETSSQADLAVSILTAADMRRIDLAGVDASRNAVARGYWSASKGLLIVADRLPAPPPGRTYQVWLIGSSSAGPVSAGLMESTGRGMLIVPAPPGVSGTTVTIAITDEPPGGLPAPTGAKHLVGSL